MLKRLKLFVSSLLLGNLLVAQPTDTTNINFSKIKIYNTDFVISNNENFKIYDYCIMDFNGEKFFAIVPLRKKKVLFYSYENMKYMPSFDFNLNSKDSIFMGKYHKLNEDSISGIFNNPNTNAISISTQNSSVYEYYPYWQHDRLVYVGHNPCRDLSYSNNGEKRYFTGGHSLYGEIWSSDSWILENNIDGTANYICEKHNKRNKGSTIPVYHHRANLGVRKTRISDLGLVFLNDSFQLCFSDFVIDKNIVDFALMNNNNVIYIKQNDIGFEVLAYNLKLNKKSSLLKLRTLQEHRLDYKMFIGDNKLYYYQDSLKELGELPQDLLNKSIFHFEKIENTSKIEKTTKKKCSFWFRKKNSN